VTKTPDVRSTIRLDKHSNGMLLTPEEFDLVEDVDECYRYELIRGVVVVTPPPSEAEADPNEELGRLLRNYRESHPRGAALDKTLSERYVRTPESRRRADRVIWAGLGRLPDPKCDPPTIAVEFVSRRSRDRRRDYEEKRREYREAGVVEYWIIDRYRRTMTVFRRGRAKRVVGEDETYGTDLLPGFALPLADLLALADEWKAR
jgi:Uma2 family endonuclease